MDWAGFAVARDGFVVWRASLVSITKGSGQEKDGETRNRTVVPTASIYFGSEGVDELVVPWASGSLRRLRFRAGEAAAREVKMTYDQLLPSAGVSRRAGAAAAGCPGSIRLDARPFAHGRRRVLDESAHWANSRPPSPRTPPASSCAEIAIQKQAYGPLLLLLRCSCLF